MKSITASTEYFCAMTRDEIFISRCIELAKKGTGSVSPNPMVGAVLVDENGIIIGEGWHQRYGEAHAEVNCIDQAVRNGQIGKADLAIHNGQIDKNAFGLAALSGLTDTNGRIE